MPPSPIKRLMRYLPPIRSPGLNLMRAESYPDDAGILQVSTLPRRPSTDSAHSRVHDALIGRDVTLVLPQKRECLGIGAVDEQDAVQVIGLVLDDGRGDPFPLEAQGIAVAV